MRPENLYFDVFPKIVPAHRSTRITIRPMFDHVRLNPNLTYQVFIQPTEGVEKQTRWLDAATQTVEPQNGRIEIEYAFGSEQEYSLWLQASADDKTIPIGDFRIYALDDDLFHRRPFKGDMHIHSYYSDGKESPAYVAAACRRIGLDFMAVTDHRQYTPSLEAMRVFEPLPIDLRIYPGEEVHPPQNPVHIINFGGQWSVNALFAQDEYMAQVQALAAQLDNLPADIDRYTYASCVWCWQQIRAGGGLGVFCHPYWLTRRRYDVPQYLVTLLFDHQPYDALELIGGYHRDEIESNNLQVARYHDERADGKRIPIVGVSDAHGCERDDLFGWYYAIVFAPSTDLPDLVQSIKELYSVAVEAVKGETAHAFGPFRLVRYAHYLMREVFPHHDKLCAQEGEHMLAWLGGDSGSAEVLRLYQGRVAALYDHLWAVG